MAKSIQIDSWLSKNNPVIYVACILWLVSIVILLGNSTNWISLGIFLVGCAVIALSGYTIRIVKC